MLSVLLFPTFFVKTKQCHCLCQSFEDWWFSRKKSHGAWPIMENNDPVIMPGEGLCGHWLTEAWSYKGGNGLGLFPSFCTWEAVCFCHWTCTSVINSVPLTLNFWLIIQVWRVRRREDALNVNKVCQQTAMSYFNSIVLHSRVKHWSVSTLAFSKATPERVKFGCSHNLAQALICSCPSFVASQNLPPQGSCLGQSPAACPTRDVHWEESPVLLPAWCSLSCFRCRGSSAWQLMEEVFLQIAKNEFVCFTSLCNWMFSSETTSTVQIDAHKAAVHQVFTFLRDCLTLNEFNPPPTASWTHWAEPENHLRASFCPYQGEKFTHLLISDPVARML